MLCSLRWMWNIKRPDNIYIYSSGSQSEFWYIHRLYQYVYSLGFKLMTSALLALPECRSEQLDDTCNLLHICFSKWNIWWSYWKPLTHRHSQLTNVRILTAKILPTLNERIICILSGIKDQLDVKVKLFLSFITRMLIKK